VRERLDHALAADDAVRKEARRCCDASAAQAAAALATESAARADLKDALYAAEVTLV
jgi:hypothetical protein